MNVSGSRNSQQHMVHDDTAVVMNRTLALRWHS